MTSRQMQAMLRDALDIIAKAELMFRYTDSLSVEIYRDDLARAVDDFRDRYDEGGLQ